VAASTIEDTAAAAAATTARLNFTSINRNQMLKRRKKKPRLVDLSRHVAAG
ncbi:hypothetical protein Dimus_016295, partial [Dionaea muscipula]